MYYVLFLHFPIFRLGDLPADCLIPYYESRRRWIFGGSGLTTRGLHVEGVNNDGSNSQFYSAKHSINDESLLSIAGVGVSTLNKTTTVRMGDYRERLLWSRAPVVGYGSSDSSSAATTAPDGSPTWSVDDDAMPISFFDPKTGEFNDSVQTRVRSRLMVNFGNPYKDKRANSLVPDAFLNQRPPLQQEDPGDPLTPPGSPPHDTFSSVEGEGEAVFAEMSHISAPRKHHSRLRPMTEKSKKRDADTSEGITPDLKRQKKETSDVAFSVIPKSTLTKMADHTSTSQDNRSTGDAKVPASCKKPVGPVDTRISPRPAPPPNPPQRKPPPPPPPSRKPPPPPPAEKRPRPIPPQPQAEKPPKPSNPPPPKHGPQKARPPPAPPDMQIPDKKPQVDLPPGWICVWSKSQKRWYFFDTKTNKSVWQWPPPGVPH